MGGWEDGSDDCDDLKINMKLFLLISSFQSSPSSSAEYECEEEAIRLSKRLIISTPIGFVKLTGNSMYDTY